MRFRPVYKIYQIILLITAVIIAAGPGAAGENSVSAAHDMHLVYEYTEFNPLKEKAYIAPYGVFYDNGTVLVASYGCITRLSPGGKVLEFIGKSGSGRGEYQFAQCIATDSKGTIYVLDNMGKKILVYGKEGNFVREMIHPVAYPMSFGVTASGTVGIADMQKSVLYIYSGAGKEIAAHNFDQGGLIAAAGWKDNIVALTSGGLDYRLNWYSEEGKLLRTRQLAITRSSYYVNNFALDNNENFFGLDMAKNLIVREDTSGRLAWAIEKIEESRRRYLNTPYSISVSPEGKEIYVVDMQNKRVLRLCEVKGVQPVDGAAENLSLAQKEKSGSDLYLVYLNRSLTADQDYVPALIEQARYFHSIELYTQAVELYSRAMEKDPGNKKISSELQASQMKLYLIRARNAMKTFHMTLKRVGPESAKEDYQEAVNNYELALKVDPSDREALNEYEALKRQYGQSTDSKSPEIDIKGITFREVFAAMYKYYNNNPVGTVKVVNTTGGTIDKLRAEVTIKDFMDYPSESRSFRGLESGKDLTIELYAVFNNRILGVSEDTPLNAEVKIYYTVAGREYTTVRNQSLNLYNRNAMTWDNTMKLSSFITPRDPVVKVYARSTVQHFRNSRLAFMNQELQKAIEIFDSLAVYGITYVSDPRTPFATFSRVKDKIDYIQYPRETLRFKTGDCDDLTVLFCSLLENLGIETAMITVPGHILMIFNTGAAAGQWSSITSDKRSIVFKNGTVWIPVETTFMGKPFIEAWEKGAQQIGLKGAETILSHEAWKEFSPVTLEDISWEPGVPGLEDVQRIYTGDINRIIERELTRRVKSLENRIKGSSEDARIFNSIGVLYARYGNLKEAERFFTKAKDIDSKYFSPLNNLGNIFFARKDYLKSLDYYKKASAIEPNNATIHINMSIVYKALNNSQMADQEYRRALALNPSLEKKYARASGGENARAADIQADESLLWTE